MHRRRQIVNGWAIYKKKRKAENGFVVVLRGGEQHVAMLLNSLCAAYGVCANAQLRRLCNRACTDDDVDSVAGQPSIGTIAQLVVGASTFSRSCFTVARARVSHSSELCTRCVFSRCNQVRVAIMYSPAHSARRIRTENSADI